MQQISTAQQRSQNGKILPILHFSAKPNSLCCPMHLKNVWFILHGRMLRHFSLLLPHTYTQRQRSPYFKQEVKVI